MVLFDVDRYLSRIHFDGRREPSLDTLVQLQAAHLMGVPFENLHVFHRVGVLTDVEWSYHKVVEQRRGGWCFELNGCFAELLRRVGYRVELLSCRTFDAATGGLSPDFDHLTLLVHVDRRAVPRRCRVGRQSTGAASSRARRASRPAATSTPRDRCVDVAPLRAHRAAGRHDRMGVAVSGVTPASSALPVRGPQPLSADRTRAVVDRQAARHSGYIRVWRSRDAAPRSATCAQRRPVDPRHGRPGRSVGRASTNVVRDVDPDGEVIVDVDLAWRSVSVRPARAERSGRTASCVGRRGRWSSASRRCRS